MVPLGKSTSQVKGDMSCAETVPQLKSCAAADTAAGQEPFGEHSTGYMKRLHLKTKKLSTIGYCMMQVHAAHGILRDARCMVRMALQFINLQGQHTASTPFT